MARLLRKRTIDKRKKRSTDTDPESTESAVTDSGDLNPVAVVVSKNVPSDSRKIMSGQRRGPADPKSVAFYQKWEWLNQSVQFLREVKIELRKVTWPSRKQAMGSTVVVIVLVLIVSVFLGVVDVGLSSLVRILLQ